MSRRTGIIAAIDGKTLNDEPLAYSSERSHLLVDPSPSKGHLQIIETTGGPMMSVSNSVAEKKEAIFYKPIPHGLSFIPRVSCRFYTRTVPAAMSGQEQRYSSYIYYNSGIAFAERIFFRVDDTNVYFVHTVESFAAGPVTTYNSIMQDALLRIKLTIYQNEGLDEMYESSLQAI